MWISILLAVVKVAGSLTSYLQQKKLIEAGEANIINKNLKDALHVIETANKARDTALADFDRNNGVPDPSDKNLRD